VSEQGSCLML